MDFSPKIIIPFNIRSRIELGSSPENKEFEHCAEKPKRQKRKTRRSTEKRSKSVLNHKRNRCSLPETPATPDNEISGNAVLSSQEQPYGMLPSRPPGMRTFLDNKIDLPQPKMKDPNKGDTKKHKIANNNTKGINIELKFPVSDNITSHHHTPPLHNKNNSNDINNNANYNNNSNDNDNDKEGMREHPYGQLPGLDLKLEKTNSRHNRRRSLSANESVKKLRHAAVKPIRPRPAAPKPYGELPGLSLKNSLRRPLSTGSFSVPLSVQPSLLTRKESNIVKPIIVSFQGKRRAKTDRTPKRIRSSERINNPEELKIFAVEQDEETVVFSARPRSQLPEDKRLSRLRRSVSCSSIRNSSIGIDINKKIELPPVASPAAAAAAAAVVQKESKSSIINNPRGVRKLTIISTFSEHKVPPLNFDLNNNNIEQQQRQNDDEDEDENSVVSVLKESVKPKTIAKMKTKKKKSGFFKNITKLGLKKKGNDKKQKQQDGMVSVTPEKLKEAYLNLQTNEASQLGKSEYQLVLLAWVNKHLKKRNLKVSSLLTGFKTGIEIINLIEILSNTTLQTYHHNPSRIPEYLENLELAIKYAKVLGISTKATPQELFEGIMSSMIDLLCSLLQKYKGKKPFFKRKKKKIKLVLDNSLPSPTSSTTTTTTTTTRGDDFNDVSSEDKSSPKNEQPPVVVKITKIKPTKKKSPKSHQNDDNHNNNNNHNHQKQKQKRKEPSRVNYRGDLKEVLEDMISHNEVADIYGSPVDVGPWSFTFSEYGDRNYL